MEPISQLYSYKNEFMQITRNIRKNLKIDIFIESYQLITNKGITKNILIK